MNINELRIIMSPPKPKHLPTLLCKFYQTDFHNYTIDMHVHCVAGPTVDSTMTLSILSSRDADPDIEYSLSFTGPPSRIKCTRDNMQLFNARGLENSNVLTREVIRSRY